MNVIDIFGNQSYFSLNSADKSFILGTQPYLRLKWNITLGIKYQLTFTKQNTFHQVIL